MRYYSMQVVDDYCAKYTQEYNGTMYSDESVYRETWIVLTGGITPNGQEVKTAVIVDQTPYELESHYTVRQYNEIPKKWQKAIEKREKELYAEEFMREHFSVCNY